MLTGEQQRELVESLIYDAESVDGWCSDAAFENEGNGFTYINGYPDLHHLVSNVDRFLDRNLKDSPCSRCS